MSIGKYNFKDITRGDTTPSTGFTVKTVSPDAPVDLTGAAIKVAFKRGKTLIEKTIGNGIAVSDPTTGVFILQPFQFIIAGCYVYDIEITYSNGSISTIVNGEINVINDVSI
tara:strand:+ start:3585 stop:3920 length:336 start_codon:yes stop_codon:yes gene_type:complete